MKIINTDIYTEANHLVGYYLHTILGKKRLCLDCAQETIHKEPIYSQSKELDLQCLSCGSKLKARDMHRRA